MSGFINQIVNGFQDFFGNIYLTVFFISIIPMVEVRGAIPIATSLGMPPAAAYLFSAVSALIVCPILVFCLKPILDALKRTRLFNKIARALEDNFRGKAKSIEDKAAEKPESGYKQKKRTFYKALGIYIFVAIPLPMTGVWTGSAVAAFLNLKHRYSIPAIIAGNFTAAGIIALLDYVLGEYSFLILIVLAVFMAVSIIGLVSAVLIKYRKNKNNGKIIVYSDKKGPGDEEKP